MVTLEATFDELKRITFDFATYSGGSWNAIEPPYDMISGVDWRPQEYLKLSVSCTVMSVGKVEVASFVVRYIEDQRWQWGGYVKNGVMFSPETIFRDRIKDVQVVRSTLLEVLEQKRQLCIQKHEEWSVAGAG